MNSDVEVVSDFKIERHDWHDPLVEACCNFVKFKDDLDLSNRTSCVHPFLVRKLRWLLGYYEPSEKMIKHRRPRRKATATYPSHFIQNRKQSLVLIHMFFCLIFLLYRSSYVPDNSAIAMIRQQLAIFYISIFIIINQ